MALRRCFNGRHKPSRILSLGVHYFLDGETMRTYVLALPSLLSSLYHHLIAPSSKTGSDSGRRWSTRLQRADSYTYQ